MGKDRVFSYDHKVDSLSPGIFFRGSLHWLAKNYNLRCKRFISAFNIANQEFSKVSPPNAVYRPDLLYSKLEVHEGCLRLTALVANVHMTVELWLMKEYGVVESWIELSLVLSINYDIVPSDLPDDSLVVWDGHQDQLDLHFSNSKEVIRVLGLPTYVNTKMLLLYVFLKQKCINDFFLNNLRILIIICST